MPIFRYFFFVGSALIALLFAADLTWPSSSVPQALAAATMDQPLIRIRSDRHLPDRVVLDTSRQTIAAPAVQTAAVAEPTPPVQEAAPAALAELSPTAKARDSFAQVTPGHPKAHAARKTDSRSQAQAQLPPSQTSQGQDLPRRKLARSHPAPQAGRMLVAQQPHFGLFDATW